MSGSKSLNTYLPSSVQGPFSEASQPLKTSSFYLVLEPCSQRSNFLCLPMSPRFARRWSVETRLGPVFSILCRSVSRQLLRGKTLLTHFLSILVKITAFYGERRQIAVYQCSESYPRSLLLQVTCISCPVPVISLLMT